MLKKLKSQLQNEQFFVTILIILVAVTSFILGQLSTTANKSTENTSKAISISSENFTPINDIETKIATKPLEDGNTSNQSPYVASKAGTKYHHITCPGAKQIKSSNKIYFATVAEAEAAGYSKAENCNHQ